MSDAATAGARRRAVSGRFELPATQPFKPIGGYGIIGNTRTAALVGYDGSIDWCCLPKFDSPSVFAALLDVERGGRWVITPEGKARSSQRYLEDTNILQTRFDVDGSIVVLTDFMPCSHLDRDWSAPPEIHREVACLRGQATLKTVVQPRFDYGSTVPNVEEMSEGVSIRDSKHEMAISSTLKMDLLEGSAEKRFRLKRGERALFVLSYGEYDPRGIDEYQTRRQLLKTEAFWKTWVSGLNYDGAWRDEVIRSALALRLLVYSPTGAIVAAPTTSLPESVGGERNWDYRFSWIRDSANSLWAFHLLGDRSESERYIHWLVDNNPSLDLDLRLMYSIDGHADVSESELKHLAGYRGSRPVRVGNAASTQLQLDAYGYMLDALHFSSKHGSSVSDEMYFRFVKPLARFICKNWKEPSNGIWEIRGHREQFVYTKAWCYAGLDRAVSIARETGHGRDAGPWTVEMRRIKREVLSRGWSRKKRSFVMHYGSEELDSANLMIPLIGFLPPSDRRVQDTIRATRRELGKGPLLYRYIADDGLKGTEGAFLLCSFWLVACLAKMKRTREAQRLLGELVGHSNHLGLYSEEVDPETGEHLGNFPQAFSHMGFIMAAFEVDRALAESRG
ncbi:MAG TPA: glycoside hydrolase family 15 protein [Nitrososphaerales archaeon]|nr:glycoside hydrolase family 15 protein [Nitrososphaerales archaeon]